MAFGASSGDRINNADGKIVIGTSVDMGGINTGLRKIEKSWQRLSYLTGGAIGVLGLVKLGQSAVNAASDLQEVQNIVDVSFRQFDEMGNLISDMTGKVDAFTQTCIEKFGMSELAAKQTAGSFMAMGKSMGLTMEEASDMSISLTGLTGDMASFYNISQDYARVALSAVYTGETETLKRYGIVLTEANLQEFANAQGIEAQVKNMVARDKALLRYQYILQATNDMQGDFERTSGSWANQTRLLKEQWAVFLQVLGSGLITVLTPVLQMLNRIVAAIISLARTIGAALVNIFGLDLQSTADQFGAVASSAGDSADAISDTGGAAGKSAKQLKKYLGEYDELKVIQQDTASGSGGSGGGGGGVGGAGLEIPTAASSMIDNLKDKLGSDIDTLFDLGRSISEKLEDALRSINWKKIYKSAENFGTGLAEFLNGLITPGLFGAVGSTIASALNTAIYTALAFGTTFDWANFGKSLAAGVNEFFATFDFAALADTIDTWVQGLYTALKTFIENVDWGQVLEKVGEFFTNLDVETVGIVIGTLVIKQIGKIIFGGTVIKVIEDLLAPLISEGVIRAFFAASSGAGLRTTVIAFFEGIFGGTAAATVATTVLGIISLIGGLLIGQMGTMDAWNNGFSTMNVALMTMGDLLVALGLTLTGIVSGPIALLIAAITLIGQLLIIHFKEPILEFAKTFKEKMDEVSKDAKEFVEDLKTKVKDFMANFDLSKAFSDAWKTIKNVWGEGVKWFENTIIKPISDKFEDLKTKIKTKFTEAKTNMEQIWKPVSQWFNNIVTSPVGQWFSNLFKTIEDVAKTCWILVKAAWIIAPTWFNKEVVEPVKKFFDDAWKIITNAAKTAWTNIQNTWTVVKNWFNTNVITPVKNAFSTFWTTIKTLASQAWTNIKTVWNIAKNWFNNTVITPIKNAFSTFWTTIKTLATQGWTNVKNAWNSAKQWFQNTVLTPLKTAFSTVWTAIKTSVTGVWTSIKNVWQHAKTWFDNNVITPLKNAFAGLANSIKGTFNTMIGFVERFINGVINAVNTFLGGLEDLGEFAASITGDDYGGITRIGKVSLPRLAQGAVIPPNKEFMAILGDQNSGTNIETPLDTMIQAFQAALDSRMGSNNQPIVLQLNGKQIAQVVWDESDKRYKQTGNTFSYIC